MSNYFQHGRRHAPGGSDPIPFLSGPSHQRDYRAYGPALLDLYLDGIWGYGTDYDYVTVESGMPGSTTTTSSANAPYGAYIELTGQNSYICLGFPLGPSYTSWEFRPVFTKAPDCGIVTVEWQTQLSGFDGKAQWGYGPDNLTSDTNWYHSVLLDNEYYNVDCYQASSEVFYSTEACPNLYLAGDAGQLVTENPTVLAYTDTVVWDGGGDGTVWWWVRMKTKTKNPSSSGYTLRFHGYSLTRIAGDLIHPG